MNEIASRGLLGEVDPRDHDPVCPEVERPTDPQPLPGLRPDERGRGRRPGRVELAEQVGLGAGAVLEVDDQPVEPGPGDQLGRHRRPEPDERAIQGLAGTKPVAEVDETGDGRGGELICHDAMMPGRRAARDTSGDGVTPPAIYGPLTSPVVSTTSRSRPVTTSSSCMTSSSKSGLLAPVMYQGDPLSARIIP